MNRLPRRKLRYGSLATSAISLLFVPTPLARAQPKVEVAPADPAVVQLAVEKGLFFVEHQSMRWWKTHKCATCHEGEILLVAANVAKSQGVPVDQEKLDFWTERWVLVDGVTRKSSDGYTVGLGMWTAPLVFIHRDVNRDDSAPRAEKWAQILRQSFNSQAADGEWDGKGVDITPLMALALADIEASKIPLPAELRTEIAERRIRTEAWIKSHEPQRPEKTESLAAWVVYEHQRGEPARAKQLLDELLSRRGDDGGWGIKRGDSSHMLVTAVVLYALKTSGLPNESPVVASTQKYLLANQAEDGRWRAVGRHFRRGQFDDSFDAWTSGHAVAALSLTLPKLPAHTKRLFTPDPAVALEVEQLTKSAAEGYQGQPDRTGDPSQPPAPKYP